MKKYKEKDLASFYKVSPIAFKARESLSNCLRRFPFMLRNYVCIIDDETGDFLYFFPLSDINKADRALKSIVLEEVHKAFLQAGFNIKEEKTLVQDIYRLGFISIMYRIEYTA